MAGARSGASCSWKDDSSSAIQSGSLPSRATSHSGTADVARRLGPDAGGHQEVRDERRGGRLAVGAGDADAARVAQLGEAEVHLGDDGHARLRRRHERRRVGRHTGRDDHGHGAPDPLEIVPPQVHGGPRAAQRARLGVEPGPLPASDAYTGDAPRAQQQRRGDPALPQPDHRDFASARAPLPNHQRTLSVESATSAQKRPRM